MHQDYDFIDPYFPAAEDVPPARILEIRAALSTLIRSINPTVDTAPNSVFGDLFVSPAAAGFAAYEIAGNRVLSDLDSENVENGVVYNCDFTRQFLLNYGIQDTSTQRSYGLLRLVFETDDERELDRSTTFLISDGEYRPFAPQAGPVFLLPPGTVGDSGVNYLNYTFIAENQWAVDILVFGNAGNLATAGAGVELDRQLDGLVAGTAVSNFLGGTTPPSLQELARRVRHNFHGRTPTTRGGATNLIHQQFPEITITGCTVSGDSEMMRDVNNPGVVTAGYLDLMARSEVLLEDTVTIRLRQMRIAGGGLGFAGWLSLPETPIKITSFKNDGIERAPTLYSVSEDPKAPGLSAAYGSSERIFVMFQLSEDSAGNPNIRSRVDDEGVYADFEVAYLFDPALKICQEFLRSDENVPAGLSVYVRWFVPVEVDSLIVDFNRKAGTTLNLSTARADIVSGFNSHRYEQPAGAALIDAALYYAGAHSVNAVEFNSYIRFSIADYVWTGASFSEPTDQASWEAFIADCVEVPVVQVDSVYTPDFVYRDTGIPSTYAASGTRNVSYLLSTSNLKLTERRSV